MIATTANTTRPRALGFGARIDDMYVRLAVTKDDPLDVASAPLQAPAVNTAVSAEDISNDFGQIFSRANFTGGSGLAFAHQPGRDPLDDTRFWDSEGVAVIPADPGSHAKLTLLPPTANIETSADSNLGLAYDGTTLLMLEGSNARIATDFTSSTPSFSTITPWNTGGDSAATVLDVTNVGSTMYFACGANGIHSRVAAGTLASLSTVATQKVWGVKRQLLASTGTGGLALDSVALAGGAHTTLVTLATGQSWLDVCDAGLAILACASDGAIYALGFDDTGAAGGVLELKAQTPMNVGEVPYAVAHDGQSVFFATREATPSGAIGRWYRAELTATFTLAGAVLLRQWGTQAAVKDCCPRRIVATRDAVFAGVQEADGRCFLWRYDRATSGVTRHLALGTGGLVVDVVAVSGRLFATVAAAGLRREKVGSFEPEGWLIGPLADFFTAALKSWAGAVVDADAIDDDTRIRLFYTVDPAALDDPDSSSWIETKNISSGRDTDETPIPNVEARYLAGMVRLSASSAADSTPALRAFSFRAYPGEGDMQVTMPVACGDVIERPGRRRQQVTGLGEQIYDSLKGREGTYCELELLRTHEIFRGVIEQIGVRVPTIARTGAPLDVVVVKFRGRRVSAAGAGAEFGSYGLFAEMQMGWEAAA